MDKILFYCYDLVNYLENQFRKAHKIYLDSLSLIIYIDHR